MAQEWVWEKVTSSTGSWTSRMKVPGGYLVLHEGRVGDNISESMVFVPASQDRESGSRESLGAVTRTSRGFECIDFKDCSEVECSLQASSLADYREPGISAIWIGPNDPNPQEYLEGQGWVKRELPEGIHTTTRAHLDRAMVKAAINHLQAWLDGGSFSLESHEGP